MPIALGRRGLNLIRLAHRGADLQAGGDGAADLDVPGVAVAIRRIAGPTWTLATSPTSSKSGTGMRQSLSQSENPGVACRPEADFTAAVRAAPGR